MLIVLAMFLVMSLFLYQELGRDLRNDSIHKRNGSRQKSEPRDPEEFDREAQIARFLEMYDLNWNYSVGVGEGWGIAASHITPRQIHPEFMPELGMTDNS